MLSTYKVNKVRNLLTDPTLTIAEVSYQTGVSASTITRIKNKFKTTAVRKPSQHDRRKTSNYKIKKIQQHISNGMLVDETARIIGVSRGTVMKYSKNCSSNQTFKKVVSKLHSQGYDTNKIVKILEAIALVA